MNCPYCGFQFGVLVVGGGDTVPPLAPLVCESCAEVSMLEHGTVSTGFIVRKISDEEFEAIKQSPAWESTIAPAIEIIGRTIKARNAHKN